MGFDENLFYQSEFSPAAAASLRKILGPRFDARLGAELSSIRYAVQALHTDRPPRALAASERAKLKTLRVKYERLAAVLRSLSTKPGATSASAEDQTLPANTKAAVAFAVHATLCKLGRFGEFSPRVKLPVKPGKFKVLRVRETPARLRD